MCIWGAPSSYFGRRRRLFLGCCKSERVGDGTSGILLQVNHCREDRYYSRPDTTVVGNVYPA